MHIRKIITLSVLSLFLPFGFVRATSPFDIGGQYNPIYVTPVQTQSQINQQKIFQLQSLYGIHAYNKCISTTYPSGSLLETLQINQTEACLKEISTTSTPSFTNTTSSSIDPDVLAQALSMLGCPENAKVNADGKTCSCDVGYSLKDGKCVSNISLINKCPNILGLRLSDDGTKCECLDGYIHDPAPLSTCSPATIAKTNSISDSAINSTSTSNPDPLLIKRLKGYILLQTESRGEAWYVNPVSEKRYYMKDGPTAYQMMRSFGLGISESDYTKIENGDTTLVNRLKGRIILRVERKGEAYWINPNDLSVHYLQNGNEAYRIMRLYSLGITDSNLQKIPSDEIATE